MEGWSTSAPSDLVLKVKRAGQMLLIPHHQAPGVKGWELRRTLGKDYPKVLDLLNIELERLDLKVKRISEGGEGASETLDEEQLDSDRFFIVSRSAPVAWEGGGGWRIDDMALLAASIAYVNAHLGKCPRKALERLLNEKFPKWRIQQILDRFIRRGYLMEDEKGVVHLGWRTRAEVDQGTLMSLILAVPGAEGGHPEEPASSQ